MTVQFPDRSTKVFGKSSTLHAAISLQNWNVFTASLKSGDIGFAETYIAGDWSTPSLSDLLRVMIQNRRVVDELIFGTWWGRMAYRIKHLLNRNHKANSRKNIHAHYDLGNAFYELWLDGTMNYSSALFEGDYSQSMGDAQRAKVRRALRMTDVGVGSRVLEIGCGWGAPRVVRHKCQSPRCSNAVGARVEPQAARLARHAPSSKPSGMRATQCHLKKNADGEEQTCQCFFCKVN